MDFGISFISNNVMIPILDTFYGIIPSYGLAIIALTLIIRFAVYPLSAKSIRQMRRTKITQPLMQKRVKEIQEKYKNDPAKQQEAMSAVYKEFGNPLSGCLPLLVQMPVLFALFATLRGAPFANVNYAVNLQIVPKENIAQVQPQLFSTAPQNIYFADRVHARVSAILPGGTTLGVGEKVKVEFQTVENAQSFGELAQLNPDIKFVPTYNVIKGQELIKVNDDGTIEALAPGDVSLQAILPGLAADQGFLFIDALGHVGAIDKDGTIHWDILAMILTFGLSLYISQTLSTGQSTNSEDPAVAQQQTVNKITPIILTGTFLFFPLPAGVLMYMVIANIFQTVQTFILNKEPLPAELQLMVEQQEKAAKVPEVLPFEKKSTGKKVTDKKGDSKKKST